ncbi:hypothetical protein [Streptomyces sp. WG5]|uniref:hypothetical protein n=1 Tax=Streptomyces sp. WG5 TaxID=3417648 RepID=UPI003CF650C8
MSDVTRQPGGIPVERDRQSPGAPVERDRQGPGAPVERDMPAPGARVERDGRAPDARGETIPGPDTAPAHSEGTTPPAVHGGALLPHEEYDELGQRLRHAVAGFVDGPRASVEEADRVLEEITARFTEAVTHRRRTLRTSWHDTGQDDRATSTDTEQLRLALRDYRELADRLMRL